MISALVGEAPRVAAADARARQLCPRRDRSAGRYYLRFLGPNKDDEGGWFDWLTGGDEDHPLADRRFLLTVDAVGGDGVEIRLAQDDDGAPLEKRQHQSLLARIQGNIN